MMQQFTGRIPVVLVCWEHRRATEMKLTCWRATGPRCAVATAGGLVLHPVTVITLN